MTTIKDNMCVDRLRSYSSAFSRSVFSDILSFSDFSQLDWLYVEYGEKLQKGCTYMDYLSYMYQALTRSYRCEYVFKNEIINQLLLKNYGTNNTIAFNEFRVGDSIVDFAIMNGESKAFEIKTSLDSPRRLKKQMYDYRKIFNKCYVVVDDRECEAYEKHLDEAVGIVTLSYEKGRIRLKEYRPAMHNIEIDSSVLIGCLRTTEYETIVKRYFGKLPDVSAYNMFDACKELFGFMDSKSLNTFFLEEIKKRKSATAHLKYSPSFLRQMILSLNLSPNKQEILIRELYKPLNNSHICTARI